MAEIQILDDLCDDDDDGERGERGKRGHRGHRGETGPTGPTGSTGSTGATGPAGSNSNTFQSAIAAIGPVVVGEVVAPSTADTVTPSIADGLGNPSAAGLVVALGGIGGTIQYRDLVVLTTAQWDAVTGQVGGLTPGPYYVSSTTRGQLTAVRPVAAGTFVTQVGLALDSTTLLLQQSMPIGPHA